METTPINQPPPELGTDPAVHLWYMRRDIGEIKSSLNELKNSYVNRNDFDEHLKADEDHEVRIRAMETFQNTLMGKMWGIGIIASFGGGFLTLVGTYLIDKFS